MRRNHVDELRRRLLAAAAIPKSSRGVAIGAEFEQERDHVGVARLHRDVQRRLLESLRIVGAEEPEDETDPAASSEWEEVSVENRS